MPHSNVLLFLTDGHRADSLGCYGSPLGATPHVDAFAAEGALFRKAFCTHSVCMPTRASLFTGRYPHIHGVWANGVPLSRQELTVPQVLRERGYATCASGKVHFQPQQQYAGPAPIIGDEETPYYGFDEVHLSENHIGAEYLQFIERRYPDLTDRAQKRIGMPEEAHELQWITDQAIDFIERQTQADRPFFCSCSFHELSPPCTPPDTYAGHYDPADMPIPELHPEDLDKRPPFYRQCYEGYLSLGRHPDEPTLRRYLASYYDQLRFLDRQFQRLVETLKRLDQWNNTLVIFTADHGLSLNDHYQWRHGPFLFDQVINVPLIVRMPDAEPGVATDELVEGVDLTPTILDWCGVPIPPGVQGTSFAGLVRSSPGAKGRDSVLIQERQAPDLLARGLDPEPIDQLGVRTPDWKLIHYGGDYPYGELYDLKNDPGEFNNLWTDPAYTSRRRDLEALLMERLAASRDPLPVREYSY